MPRTVVSYEVDLDMTAAAIDPPFVFSIEGVDKISIESSSFSGTAWTTSTVTVEVTNDPYRGNWKGVPGGAVTIASATITNVTLTGPFRWMRLRTSTGAASAFKAHYDIFGTSTY